MYYMRLTVTQELFYGLHMKRSPATFRITDELAKRLEKATDKRRFPYAPTKTQLFLRGLELSLREVERKA